MDEERVQDTANYFKAEDTNELLRLYSLGGHSAEGTEALRRLLVERNALTKEFESERSSMNRASHVPGRRDRISIVCIVIIILLGAFKVPDYISVLMGYGGAYQSDYTNPSRATIVLFFALAVLFYGKLTRRVVNSQK